jgi:hypothetical protein
VASELGQRPPDFERHWVYGNFQRWIYRANCLHRLSNIVRRKKYAGIARHFSTNVGVNRPLRISKDNGTELGMVIDESA